MKNTTIIIFMSVFCMLFYHNISAQTTEKKSNLEGVKVIVRQESINNKIEKVEPENTNKPIKSYSKDTRSTSQRKATQQNDEIQPLNRTTLNSKTNTSTSTNTSYPNKRPNPTKEDLDKEIVRVKLTIEDMRKSNVADKEMTLAKLDKTLEYLLDKRNQLFPEK